MTHLCQEVALVIEYYSETQKQCRRQIFTSTATLKGCNNVAPHCSMCQQTGRTTSLNPKLICPHRICCGPVGWEERTGDCVLFLPPASQTVALTKYPFCTVSFHSDWTNWDLLTANPIRAGTGQSHPGICHPWHTGLPLAHKGFCLCDLTDLLHFLIRKAWLSLPKQDVKHFGGQNLVHSSYKGCTLDINSFITAPNDCEHVKTLQKITIKIKNVLISDYFYHLKPTTALNCTGPSDNVTYQDSIKWDITSLHHVTVQSAHASNVNTDTSS